MSGSPVGRPLGRPSGRPSGRRDMDAIVCDAVFKATKVDGVYSEDPVKNPKAKKYESLSFGEAFKNDKIKIMDKAAVELCMRHNLKIVVFNTQNA